MGYTTEFQGSFKFSKKPTPDQLDYLDRFARSHRVQRDVVKLKELYGGKYGLDGEYGEQGEYFAIYYSNDDPTVTYYSPPASQPGVFCQWVVFPTGNRLGWDGGEKFYHYIEWLEYLIKHFFTRWDIQLNGEVEWQGERSDDRGVIIVLDNVVHTRKIAD
jgi:hypothetical protein